MGVKDGRVEGWMDEWVSGWAGGEWVDVRTSVGPEVVESD